MGHARRKGNLEQRLGHAFANHSLLVQALTPPSAGLADDQPAIGVPWGCHPPTLCIQSHLRHPSGLERGFHVQAPGHAGVYRIAESLGHGAWLGPDPGSPLSQKGSQHHHSGQAHGGCHGSPDRRGVPGTRRARDDRACQPPVPWLPATLSFRFARPSKGSGPRGIQKRRFRRLPPPGDARRRPTNCSRSLAQTMLPTSW